MIHIEVYIENLYVHNRENRHSYEWRFLYLEIYSRCITDRNLI